jgi:hypothetical protein
MAAAIRLLSLVSAAALVSAGIYPGEADEGYFLCLREEVGGDGEGVGWGRGGGDMTRDEGGGILY